MFQQPTHQVLAHVDLDAFYAQVEALRDPDRLAGKPLGVVQYNPYGNLKSLSPDDDRLLRASNGSLIAVSYEARAAGVKRNMRGDAARALCPELQLVQVPTAHGKADLTHYREAGKRVLDILASRAKCERASIDECYLDLTSEAQRLLAASGGLPPMPVNLEQVHVMGDGGELDATAWWQRPPGGSWGEGEQLLACGAVVVSELRHVVHQDLGYTCSAGLAHTKLMAKLASGLHKPAQQTVVPAAAVAGLLAPLPISKLRQLGGKFGERVVADLSVQTVGELAAVPLARLQQLYGEKDGAWLHALARGVDEGGVEERTLPKSLSCGKSFRGTHALQELDAVARWLGELAGELEERLLADQEANHRTPQLLTVSWASQPSWVAAAAGGGQGAGAGANGKPAGGQGSVSRSCVLRRVQAAAMTEDAAALLRRWAKQQGAGWSIGSLYLAASNFLATGEAPAITKFFKPAQAQPGASVVPGAGADNGGGGSSRSDRGAASGAAAPAALAAPCSPKQFQLQQQQQQDQTAGSNAAAEASSTLSTPPGDLQAGTAPAEAAGQRGPAAGAVAGWLERPRGEESWSMPGVQGAAEQTDAAAVQGGSSSSRDLEEGGVNPEVLAELPPSLQREIKAQLKAQQMLRSTGPATWGAAGRGAGAGAARGAKRQKSAGRGIASFFEKQHQQRQQR